MKFVNLETGKASQFVKSNKGFKVVYPHGADVQELTTIRAIQTILEDMYIVWSDYSVYGTNYVMFTSLETNEKFLVVRD